MIEGCPKRAQALKIAGGALRFKTAQLREKMGTQIKWVKAVTPFCRGVRVCGDRAIVLQFLYSLSDLLFIHEDHRVLLKEYGPINCNEDNTQAELFAIFVALKSCEGLKLKTIHTDSQACIAMIEGCPKRAQALKIAGGALRFKTAQLREKMGTQIKWVKAHQTSNEIEARYNQLADKLANG